VQTLAVNHTFVSHEVKKGRDPFDGVVRRPEKRKGAPGKKAYEKRKKKRAETAHRWR